MAKNLKLKLARVERDLTQGQLCLGHYLCHLPSVGLYWQSWS